MPAANTLPCAHVQMEDVQGLSARGSVIIGGSCPGAVIWGKFSQVGIVRGELSQVAIIRGAIIQGVIVRETIVQGGSCPVSQKIIEKYSKMDTKANVKSVLSSLRAFSAAESLLKMMKKVFYFTSKALFVLKVFKFLS